MDDSDYLRLLTIQAEQANAFLSNARKWERERWVCQRLLQGLNIPYRSEDFTPAGQEPPDVLFRDCLLYTSPSPRDRQKSRMPSSA